MLNIWPARTRLGCDWLSHKGAGPLLWACLSVSHLCLSNLCPAPGHGQQAPAVPRLQGWVQATSVVPQGLCSGHPGRELALSSFQIRLCVPPPSDSCLQAPCRSARQTGSVPFQLAKLRERGQLRGWALLCGGGRGHHGAAGKKFRPQGGPCKGE